MGTFRRCGAQCRYLNRRPERLVVEAFRRWNRGGESGSFPNFQRTADFFVDELGPVEGRRLFSLFVRWLDTVGDFMERPPLSSPFECPRLCQDECMAVAMIAAAQSGDRDGIDAATRRLVAPEGIEPAAAAAEGFAEALANHGHHLLPVPAAIVRDIAERPERRAFH
jgi:hypothetical protein